jgi:uncharacterized phage protein gp47/JayE
MPMTLVGYVPPTPDQVLTAVQDTYKNAYGSGFNINPSSPNGLIISNLTLMGIQVVDVTTFLYDGIYNPNLAQGVWLDAICKFNYITRKPAVSSSVVCNVTGTPGVVIPMNSQILNDNDDIFFNPAAITIGVGGTGSGTFTSLVTGPIECNAGSLTRIVAQLPGWDTVTNPANGTVGTNVQTDYSLRNTRIEALAIKSASTLDSMISRLADNGDIKDFYVAENTTNAPITVRGVTVSAHSMYISVFGGTSSEIAAIIYATKGDGCGMNGNTTVNYQDPNYIWVVQPITYQTAVETPLQVNITIPVSTSYPSNIDDLIKQAILDNFNGATGLAPVNMRVPPNNVTLDVTRFYSSLASLGIYNTISITVQTVIGGTPASTIDLPATEAPTLILANIIVTQI